MVPSFTIQTQTRKGIWRKLPDCEFQSRERAEAYGLKYHSDRYGSRYFRVVEFDPCSGKVSA